MMGERKGTVYPIASHEALPSTEGSRGKIIAVDFDGVLCKEEWPRIGEAHEGVIARLIKRRQDGDKLILWTCRSGALLDEAIIWCNSKGLRFDAINENLPERIKQYGNNSRKVSADEYWEDKAVLIRGGSVISASIITEEIP